MSTPRIRNRWFVLVTAFVVGSLLTSVSPAAASDWAPTWSRDFGQRINSVAIDGSGNSYATGFGGRFMKVRSYAPDGRLRWARSWYPGGRHPMARGVDIVVEPDGYVYVAGTLYRDNLEGPTGWFVRSYGAGGALRWHVSFRDGAGISGIAVNRTSIVVTGNHSGCCGEAFSNGWVKGLTLSGSLRWTNSFEDPRIPAGYDDEAAATTFGPNGSVFVAGWVARAAESTTDQPAPHDVMVQRISASGHRRWSKIIVRPRAVPKHLDEASGIDLRGTELAVAARVNRVVKIGYYQPGHPALWRLALDGTQVWFRQWGLNNAPKGETAGVAIGPHGGVYVSGTTFTRSQSKGFRAFLRKYSPSGVYRRDAEISSTKASSSMWGTHTAIGRTNAYLVGTEDDRIGWLWRLPA